MPLARTQAVLKRVLPEGIFDSLYDRACNVYDAVQHLRDEVYYHTPSLRFEENLRKSMLHAVHGHTMTSRVGLLATYDAVMQVEREAVKGDLVECGVARGGCAALMALVTRAYTTGRRRRRRTWLFDSYEGLPEQSEHDGEQKPVRHTSRTANDLATGYCLGTYEDVSKFLYTELRLSFDNVVMVRGWFQDTLPEYRGTVGRIAVLRLDGDWYESTKCCLENLYENVVAGGFVIIDDYQLPGCRKAVDEFLVGTRQAANMSFDVNGRAYWRRAE